MQECKVSIKLNREEIFNSEVNSLFQLLKEMDLQARKSFVKYLDSPFFTITDPAGLALAFKVLVKAQRRSFSETAAFTITAKSLLLRQPKEHDLSIEQQHNILQARLNQLTEQLSRFFVFYRLQQADKMEEAQQEFPKPDLPLSLPQTAYDSWDKKLEDQPSSPYLAIQRLAKHYAYYFLNTIPKNKRAENYLVQLEHELKNSSEMVGTMLRLERASRLKIHGKLPQVQPLSDAGSEQWLLVFEPLATLLEKSTAFDWEGYENCKQLIADHYEKLHLYNQILACEYIINYVNDGFKKGALGLEKEHLFWIEFRIDHHLVSPVNEISDHTYLNFVNTLGLNHCFEQLATFKEVYLPRVIEKKREDAEWMGSIIEMFYRSYYLGVLEALEKVPTGNRNAELPYTIRRMVFRLRSILAINILDLENDVSATEFGSYQAARKTFSTHLSDARKVDRYPDWYQEANESIVQVCNHIYRTYQSQRLEEDFDELVKIVQETKLLPVRSWYLDFLTLIKNQNGSSY